MNNNYALFYKTDKHSHWKSTRPDLPVNEWENYAKEQNYAEYEIKDLTTYSADMLHLLTDVILYNGKYYLPDEKVKYPDSTPNNIERFEIDTVMDEDYANDEVDFDETYNKQTINWDFGYLWTEITTKLIFADKVVKLALIAQEISQNLPKFIKVLEKNSYAVYTNIEFSKFKWIAWIKGTKIRLIHQTYENDNPKTEFDMSVDKNLFFDNCNNLILKMKEYAEADQNRYEKYVKEKYGN